MGAHRTDREMTLNAETHLALCESIAIATGRMRAAAENADWDALIETERTCFSLVERLRGVEPPPLDAEGRARKARLMRAMLADDRAVRDRAQPELARLQKLLSGARQAASYQASDPA